MSKIEEMQAKLAILINTAQDYLDKDDLENADKVQKQAQELADKIEKQKALDKLSANLEIPQPTLNEGEAKNDAAQTKENASFIRAALKKLSGTKLTEAEDALLLPSVTYPNGEHGEGYILPQDIRTKIKEKLRQFRSLREVCGYLKTTALTGSYPSDNDETEGLIDFTDGTDGTYATDPVFSPVSWSLKEKGAFIKISNTLLSLTDNDLIAYIVRRFAKKAVITENAMAKAKLEANKTAKNLSDWAALKASINVDLDPGSLYNTKIVTNQDGFNVLDQALDLNGRPVLQPDPTQPTRKLFMGYPIEVYSNAMIPSDTTNNVAPIYYGDIEDGVQFVDLDNISFASSKEAGFMSNTTICRLIEWVDVVQADASDKCYCFGKLSLGE